MLSPTAAEVSLYAIFLLCILAVYTVPHPVTINFLLVLSDGCTQLQPDPEACQQGFHTQGHSPQPGWSQPGGHSLLSHPAYSQHAMHFPGLPAETHHRGHIYALHGGGHPRVRSRPQVMSRRCLRVKMSRSTHTPRTPSLVLVSSLGSTRTLTQSLTLGKKSRLRGKSSTRTAPRKTSVDHHPQRKSHQPTRHSEMELGKKRGCLTHALMPGILTKLPTMLWAGQCEIP